MRLDDPGGRYGDGPDSYELDVVTDGDGPEDRWAVEAKHRRGALTRPMVERFLRAARAVEAARGERFLRLWVVASRGARPDAQQLIQEAGLLSSGLRQLDHLERLVGGTHDLHDFDRPGRASP